MLPHSRLRWGGRRPRGSSLDEPRTRSSSLARAGCPQLRSRESFSPMGRSRPRTGAGELRTMNARMEGSAVDYSTVTLGGIDVCFTEDLDGGGARYGQDYVGFVANLATHAGPFHRTLSGVRDPASSDSRFSGTGSRTACALPTSIPQQWTRARRRSGETGWSKASTSMCPTDSQRSPPSERWNLVVGNPRTRFGRGAFPRSAPARDLPGRRLGSSTRSSMHRWASHLAPGAQAVIQENLRFSSAKTFSPILDANGLRLVDSPRAKRRQATPCTSTRSSRGRP